MKKIIRKYGGFVKIAPLIVLTVVWLVILIMYRVFFLEHGIIVFGYFSNYFLVAGMLHIILYDFNIYKILDRWVKK